MEELNYPFNLVDIANEDIRKYGKEIQIVRDEDDGYYSVDILTLDDGGNTTGIYTFAENLFENELADAVNDAWANVRKKERLKTWRNGKRITPDTSSLYARVCNALSHFEEDADCDIEEEMYQTLVEVHDWMQRNELD